MSSAGKWVLGLLLLVVGAVFVAKTVSSDPGSQAEVKNNLPAAAPAADKVKKPAGPVTAADLACKKVCVEVNEVANDSITTAKIAPGSITLSKLAFEVPNLNELENEINARKATEASLRSSQSALSATQAEAASAAATAIEANARNAAAINAAAANGITAEAAARQAADEDIAQKFAAGDADLQNKLNTEGANRAAGDDVLQGKLNLEIADRTTAVSTLRGELANPNQVDAPIIKINTNEIVGTYVDHDGLAGTPKLESVVGAVTGEKIADGTIEARDLGTSSVVGGFGGDVMDNTISAEDLADNAVVGRAVAGNPLLNVTERTLRGERVNNTSTTTAAGDLALGTITGQGTPTAGTATGNIALGTITGEAGNADVATATGNLGLLTVGRKNLALNAVDTEQLADGAVTSTQIDANTIETGDVSTSDLTNLTSDNIRTGTLRGTLTEPLAVAVTAGDIAAGTISGQGDNDDNPVLGADNVSVTGNLGLNTVGRRNIVDGAIDATKLSTTVFDGFVTEVELTALLLSMKSDEAGATAPKGPNDGDGFLHWNHLEAIPEDIADGDDDDGGSKVNQLKTDLADGSSQPNDGVEDYVSFSVIKDLTTGGGTPDGRITGAFIKNGDIGALDLAGDSVDTTKIKDGTIIGADLAGSDTDTDPVLAGDQFVTGAVTSEKIADGQIQARDIAKGTVTSDELKANATGIVGTNSPAGIPAMDKLSVVQAVLNIPTGPAVPPGAHKVLLTGQATLDCSTCPAGTLITYSLGEVGNINPIGPEMKTTVEAANADVVLPVSFVTEAAQGVHTYELRVTGNFAPGTAKAISPTLSAVDLGRA